MKTYKLQLSFVVIAILAMISAVTIVFFNMPQYYKAYSIDMVSNKSPADQAIALKLLEELGETNVTVIFTNREDINCGAAKAESKKGGCFRHSTPGTIYISPGVDEEILKYLVYHEYAHLLHHRNGEEGGECAADEQAMKWGASLRYSSYTECNLVKNEHPGVKKNIGKHTLEKKSESEPVD